jgi:DNA-binding NarL/FixJ family response regulator
MTKYSSDDARFQFGPNVKRVARIAWIDTCSLTREAIAMSLKKMNPDADLSSFNSVRGFISKADSGFALILCYSHGSHQECVSATSALRLAFTNTRLIMLSDLDQSHQTDLMRDILTAGADGLIATRVTGLAVASSAIRFVQAGGTLPFPELGRATSAGLETADAERMESCKITPRQRQVLIELQRGKSNKVIAYELGMSESTAKVHIRNLMKKMGATNRTQAAFNGMRFYPDLIDRT